jgi:hypothetical protein
MTVGDANRDASFCGEAQREAAEQIDVTVYDVKGPVLAQDAFEFASVFDRISRAGAMVNVGSERANLMIIRGFFRRVDQEMKAKLGSIDRP